MRDALLADAGAQCSSLSRRLLYMDRFPERQFTNLIENVPRWPAGARTAPAQSWGDIDNYAPCAGVPELAERVARREASLRGVPVKAGNILVTHGGLYGLSLIFRALSAPRSVALCQAPVLGAIPQMLRAAGHRVVFFETPGGELDPERIDAMSREGAALIYLNSPDNPTGRILSGGHLSALARISRERSVKLVVDMVYDSYVFDRPRADSPLSASDDWGAVYVVNSMSKNYGAPGIRVGWILSAEENIELLAGHLEREAIAVSGRSQRDACSLLDQGNDALVGVVAAGKQSIERWLAASGRVRAGTPSGGCQYFVALPVDDVEAFCDFALAELGLGLVSASNYEGVSGPFIRLPMGAPPAVLARGLSLLGDALDRYPSR